MNNSYQRQRMVEEQLQARDISDPKVLETMRKIPRELFVEEALRSRAYGDYPLPIGEGQTISQPYMVARMTELLELKPNSRVLEIGTGSGYQTAVLADLAEKVFTIERHASLSIKAQNVLQKVGYENIAFLIGDGSLGWIDKAPFEAIIVTAAAPVVPESLLEQLADPGIMVIPVGSTLGQILQVIKKSGCKLEEVSDCSCVFVKLLGKYGFPEDG